MEHDVIAVLARDEPMDLVIGRADRRNVPGSGRRTVEADRGCVLAAALEIARTLVPSRREDHVLDGTALKGPEEVPFAAQLTLLAIRRELSRFDIPRSNELAEEHQRFGVLRVRTGGANDLLERRATCAGLRLHRDDATLPRCLRLSRTCGSRWLVRACSPSRRAELLANHARGNFEPPPQRGRQVTVVREAEIGGYRRQRGVPSFDPAQRCCRAQIREITVNAHARVGAELAGEIERRVAHETAK